MNSRGYSHSRPSSIPKFLHRKPTIYTVTVYITLIFLFSIAIFVFYTREVLEDEQMHLPQEDSQFMEVWLFYSLYWRYAEKGFVSCAHWNCVLVFSLIAFDGVYGFWCWGEMQRFCSSFFEFILWGCSFVTYGGGGELGKTGSLSLYLSVKRVMSGLDLWKFVDLKFVCDEFIMDNKKKEIVHDNVGISFYYNVTDDILAIFMIISSCIRREQIESLFASNYWGNFLVPKRKKRIKLLRKF